MKALEGKIMIDCVDGVRERESRGKGGETRFQVFDRLNEEQTCTIQDSEGEKIIICR